MRWHTVALRLALALVPALVLALRDGRITENELESLHAALVDAVALALKP